MIRDRPNPSAPPGPGPERAQRGPAGPACNVQYDPIQELVSCAQLAACPALGHCRPGATVAAIEPDYGGGLIGRVLDGRHHLAVGRACPHPTWTGLPIDTLVVATDGSTAAVERARGMLELAYPARSPRRP